jgi:hypothetical protein
MLGGWLYIYVHKRRGYCVERSGRGRGRESKVKGANLDLGGLLAHAAYY